MKKIKYLLWGIPVGFINGFFGSGGGVVAVLVLKKVLKMSDKKAHATAISIILPLSCASLFVYSRGGTDMKTIFLCAAGGVFGSVIGAKALNKMPKKWIKISFGAVMIISGARMIL